MCALPSHSTSRWLFGSSSLSHELGGAGGLGLLPSFLLRRRVPTILGFAPFGSLGARLECLRLGQEPFRFQPLLRGLRGGARELASGGGGQGIRTEGPGVRRGGAW